MGIQVAARLVLRLDAELVVVSGLAGVGTKAWSGVGAGLGMLMMGLMLRLGWIGPGPADPGSERCQI